MRRHRLRTVEPAAVQRHGVLVVDAQRAGVAAKVLLADPPSRAEQTVRRVRSAPA